MKLMVKYKGRRNIPFHPTLKLMDTGYAWGHWQEMHFRPGLFCGAGTVRERNVEQAIAQYFKDLRRMGYEIVEG